MRRLRTERREGQRVRFWRRGHKEPVGIGRWFSSHSRVFAFLAVFGGLVVGFYFFIFFVPIYSGKILPGYLRFIAMASAKILAFLGENTQVMGTDILSSRFSLCIEPGCDAIEATGLFVCAILAFQANLLQKVAAILGGVLVFAVLNLVRVVSLFFIGVHWPRIVNVIHIEVWQGLFIIFAVMLWVIWLLCIAQNQPHIQSARPSAPGGS